MLLGGGDDPPSKRMSRRSRAQSHSHSFMGRVSRAGRASEGDNYGNNIRDTVDRLKCIHDIMQISSTRQIHLPLGPGSLSAPPDFVWPRPSYGTCPPWSCAVQHAQLSE